ncbi:hypothetical protein GCM10023170_097680 [Phytohabitans houttuyneae]|uniref:Uncharacterized protein n=1 Tax=Phytohabitans houttuyneae TaxID=1076126 RepID=A0A6V8K2F3_9ACTN|nr:hypothetical protein Phou_020640 [Phytohabitans houttuyneae]
MWYTSHAGDARHHRPVPQPPRTAHGDLPRGRRVSGSVSAHTDTVKGLTWIDLFG